MPDWTAFCRAKEFEVDAPRVWVTFPNGRRQRVHVLEHEHTYRLLSTVAGPRAVETLASTTESYERLALRILQRNRSAPLVGFRLTPKGRLVAESHVSRIGLEREEFRLHLRRVAREADRLEFLLTGKDRN